MRGRASGFGARISSRGLLIFEFVRCIFIERMYRVDDIAQKHAEGIAALRKSSSRTFDAIDADLRKLRELFDMSDEATERLLDVTASHVN